MFFFFRMFFIAFVCLYVRGLSRGIKFLVFAEV